MGRGSSPTRSTGNTRHRACLAALATVTLTACSAALPEPTEVAAPGMPNPETALHASMRTVEAEMAQIGGLADRLPPVAAPVTATSPAPDSAPPPAAGPVLPEPLLRPVTFAWDGPLDAAVARLAQSVGYTTFVSAPPGHTPVPVAVTLTDVPAHAAFRALGDAAGTQATVRLVPSRAQVQVLYR